MNRYYARVCFLVLAIGLLPGCLSGVWTGATLIYNRHSLYKQADDFQLGAEANRRLYQDVALKCPDCYIDVAVLNGDILIAGHVPSSELRKEAQKRVRLVRGYRRLFNQLSVGHTSPNALQDSWITGKIRAQILADSAINPKHFKVVTSDRIVYLMGDVIPAQAVRVVRIARKTAGVKKVVKLFRYYNLSDRPASK